MPITNPVVVPAGLPALDPDSARHGQAVQAYLIKQIEQSESWGFMPFDQWMNLALYAPGLGYYAAGSAKFGGVSAQGDFATAPELTPVFGQILARQVAQVLRASDSVHVLEFGAGSGALAAVVIASLRAMDIDPIYQILEVSGELRARQQERLAEFGSRVQWLDALPVEFSGCVLANEVLDAMPVTLFRWGDDATVFEVGVSLGYDRGEDGGISLRHRRAGGIQASLGRARLDESDRAGASGSPFMLTERQASARLQQAVAQRMEPLPEYQSEINFQAEAWIAQMGTWLKRGAALLIDYGFPRREYYHPQRTSGTLMCHFRHHAHSQPLIYAGLQDITSHVDFTALADAALASGLDVLGYTSQARFLINAGLGDLLSQFNPENALEHARMIAPIQKLISEAEMGELFKVLAIGRDIEQPLMGFATGDRRPRL